MSGEAQACVLVVEDDENLRLTLVDNLEEEGYRVAQASTAAAARESLGRAEPWDVVVLDLMLPDGDGYTLCRELRRSGASSRVLMLTARTLEDDVVRGFDEGADDYLAKPYRMRELLARIRALSRRTPAAQPPSPLSLGGMTVDVTSRQVLDPSGRPVELTRTEFDFLLFLLRNVGRALRRDEILDAVWGQDVVVDSHTVDNFVSNLRRKLGWTAGAGWQLKAVRGVGYRLERTRA